ncbi:MAG: 30S ribosomal protein S13 [Planctomycetes bacterium]|nr:30S ribosomal protein S13 [Planctomycetota bacterium]
MPRIVGVDIPAQKKIGIALTSVYGIGYTTARRILAEVGISTDVRAKDLTDDDVSRIANTIEKNHVVEGQLRRQVQQNLARLREIACYRGLRHRRGLPVRGQKTRANARTRKGPRKTVAGKKSVKGQH